MTFLLIYVAPFSSLGLNVGCRKQIGKWSEISILNINVLKLVFTDEFVGMWSIKVGVFLVTLEGVFTIGRKLFW